MWSKALSFILDAENQRFLLLIALVGALVFGFNQCERKQAFEVEVEKQKNNIAAMQDSVTYYENEAGELTAEKLALQADKEQLETLNKDLHEEIEKEQDRVEQLTQVNAELRSDTSETDTTSTIEIEKDQWRFDWNLSRSGERWDRVLTGYTEFYIKSPGVPYNPTTKITKDLIRLQFTTGVTEDEGQRSIFIRSSYPNLRVTDIQGAIIEESTPVSTPSRFGVGFHLGGGYTPQGFQPYVGFGFNYNLITF